MDKVDKIKQLIKELNNASYAYYNQVPIMPDYEWDKMYEELQSLEKETGIVLSNSPTHNVGYKVADELKEVKHNHPMLSLDKTKSVEELIEFAGDNNCLLSVKCDGLTTSLHYIDGVLVSAETRGNGMTGQDVLQNVLTMSNVPKKIPYKDELIIDGETIIGWDTFNKINENLTNEDKYKHPRNLVSGSLQLLNSKEAAERNMRFIAWRVIKGFKHESVFFDLKEAEKNGFDIVPMWTYSNNSSDKDNLHQMLEDLRKHADDRNIPYDGAVMAIDDYKIAESMGRTNKFFRHSVSYKYEDELFETMLTDIKWNTSKTGLINPVAIFEPVDLNGAVTTRATLHNVTYIKKMMLGVGDRIRVYRSNMVIPKVHDSIDKSGNFEIPDKCPVCGQPTKIVKDNDSEVLMCTNENCRGRLLGKLKHAVSRDCLNIDGLSDATLDRFISLGLLNSIKDIYHLSEHENELKSLEGFGKKSVDKLLASIEKSRLTSLERFLSALSIPLLGKSTSEIIADSLSYEFDDFVKAMMSDGAYHFLNISGVGDALIKSLDDYFVKNYTDIIELSKEFTFETPRLLLEGMSETLDGKTFVITGSVNHYANRDELKDDIVLHGGKVVGSISSKTDYLINNDINSTSSKNMKAKSLNIPIISEEDFLAMIR